MAGIQKTGSKRQTIIEAAAQVFSDKGYHNARMEEVAVKAGIGKGTIYEYFESKLQLFQAVMENSIQLYYDKITPDEGDSISFAEWLRRLLESHVCFCRDNRQLTRIVFWDTEVMDKELKEWVMSLRKEKEDAVARFIARSIQKGEMRALDPYVIIIILEGVIASLWGPISLDDWNADASELAASITDMIMRGISAS